MSETKFTPGPWRCEIDEDTQEPRVYSLQRENKLREQLVCVVGYCREDLETAEPTARLIAAAPEMYEALADASFYLKSLGVRLAALDLDTIETYGTLKTAAMFASVLDAALAKARGVSPTPPEGGRDMSAAHEDDMDYLDTEKCWHCGGEGGYASCQEDCCPYEGGEEACDDPVCLASLLYVQRQRLAVCRAPSTAPGGNMTTPTPLEAAARALNPARIAKDAAKRVLTEIRKRAWVTRRNKYGPKGHAGSYSR